MQTRRVDVLISSRYGFIKGQRSGLQMQVDRNRGGIMISLRVETAGDRAAGRMHPVVRRSWTRRDVKTIFLTCQFVSTVFVIVSYKIEL